MKKIIIILAFAVLGLGSAAAQSPKWQYGIQFLLAASEARWTSAAPTSLQTLPHWGPSYGFFVRYRVSNRVALESGLTLVSKDDRLRFTPNQQYSASFGAIIRPTVEIPLLAVLPFRLNEKYNWYVGAGVAGTFNRTVSHTSSSKRFETPTPDNDFMEVSRFDGQRFSISGQTRLGFERIKNQAAVWSVGLVYNYQFSPPVVRGIVTYSADGVRNQAQMAYNGSYVGMNFCYFIDF